MDIEPWVTIIGFVASIASLILAIVAIWLSLKFFDLSNKQAKEAEKASREIAGAVGRLENLFDRMYSDTFGMVQNMQEKIWQMVPVPVAESESTAPPQPTETDEESTSESPPAPRRPLPNRKEDSDDPRTETRSVLSRRERRMIRERAILNALKSAKKSGIAGLTLADFSRFSAHLEDVSLAGTLFVLRNAGVITWDGPASELNSRSIVRLVEQNEGSPE